jgi:hypothetical protein
MRRDILMVALCATAITVPAHAQTTPPAAAQTPPASPANPPRATPAPLPGDTTPKLIFEREVFTYSGKSRPDPFQPLAANSASGPLFPDLRVGSIAFYEGDPSRSRVMIRDASNKLYLLKRGDTVGNATITGIEKRRVIFSVVDFGIRSTKILELKKKEGAAR